MYCCFFKKILCALCGCFQELLKNQILIGLLSFLFISSLMGCGEDEDKGITEPVTRAVYIINELAQTISVFDIEKSEMKNDVLTVGKWPADIKVSGDNIYVANTGDNNIQIIDPISLKQVGMINTGDNTGPERIGFLGDTKAYVSCLNTNSVKSIDLAARQVVKDIPVGIGPMGVAVAGKKVYVCNPAYDFVKNSYGQGTVSIINSSTDTVIKVINVETNPLEAIAIGDKILVLCNGNYADITGKLCIIDTASDTVVKTVDLGATPSGIAVSPKSVVYITIFGGLISVDIGSSSMIHTMADPLKDFAGGSRLAFTRDGTCYICVPDWAGSGNDKLLVMDASEKLIGTYKASGGANSIAVKE